MTGDHRAAVTTKAEGCRTPHHTIKLEVAAAHPRSFDLEHHLVGPRFRVREVHELNLSITQKNDTLHCSPHCLLYPACSSPAQAENFIPAHNRIGGYCDDAVP
ncbi:MAG: hypothetical protein Ct9H300mP16_01390 [Pseudomonadota bacterium]|nr:MAG: hypothetical protein Ct9H300mP16_01390 [Pseudomonadota bacterium]